MAEESIGVSARPAAARRAPWSGTAGMLSRAAAHGLANAEAYFAPFPRYARGSVAEVVTVLGTSAACRPSRRRPRLETTGATGERRRRRPQTCGLRRWATLVGCQAEGASPAWVARLAGCAAWYPGGRGGRRRDPARGGARERGRRTWHGVRTGRRLDPAPTRPGEAAQGSAGSLPVEIPGSSVAEDAEEIRFLGRFRRSRVNGAQEDRVEASVHFGGPLLGFLV